MPKILYIGFGEMMKSLQSKLTSDATLEFREILQLGTEVQGKGLSEADTFLIGPYTLEPIKQVQRAFQQDPMVSIVALIFPDRYHQIKQRIQFAYNVGKHVVFVPYTNGKDISSVLDNAVLRTRQRKSFARLQQQQSYPAPLARETTFQNLGVFLENAPIGAIVFDENKKILSANFRAKQQFPIIANQRHREITWADLFPEETPMPDVELSEAQTGEPLHDIVKVNNHFLEINISPLRLEKEKPHYLLLINDVTDKINIENQLKSKIDELEFLNQELDEFVNVVSHDFKTPLTSISLLAEMALKEKSPEKQLHFVSQIKQSSTKLRELLKGLATLVDTKKERVEKMEYVSFSERLDIVLSEYRALLQETGGAVHADFSHVAGMVYFKAHIDSFLSNLVTNAIKYRRPDVPLRIEVSSRKEKEYLILSVKDNGTGIDLTKNMNKLFQPFKRLTNQGTGSGLGLSIIKRMIEKDQGYLEVFSEPGQGTEFKAYLKEQVKS